MIYQFGPMARTLLRTLVGCGVLYVGIASLFVLDTATWVGRFSLIGVTGALIFGSWLIVAPWYYRAQARRQSDDWPTGGAQ